jgi:hypothetical protein
MEFAENYSSRPQDGPQGCHWNNSQTMIHPVVASYMCHVPECQLVITDSVIFISDDLTHDQHAVQHFMTTSVKLLKTEGVPFDTLLTFLEGAPTQYKNWLGFVDCSHAPEDFDLQAERHFFGSRHGTGPCDREIGVIKKSVIRLVAARQIDILTARDLFNACKQRLRQPH